MRPLAALAIGCLSLLLGACTGEDRPEPLPPGLRSAFEEACVANRWEQAADRAAELLDRGARDADLLIEMAEASRLSGRHDQLLAILLRLLNLPAAEQPDEGSQDTSWEALGRVCGLRGDSRPLLEEVERLDTAEGVHAAIALEALVETARVAGNGERVNAAMIAAAERIGGEAADLLRSRAPFAIPQWGPRERIVAERGTLLDQARLAGMRGDYARSREKIAAFLARPGSDRAQRMLAQGNALLVALCAGEGNPADWLERCSGTMDEFLLYEVLGRYDDALAWLERHRAHVPRLAGYQLRVLREAGRRTEALAKLRELEEETGIGSGGKERLRMSLGGVRLLMEDRRWSEALHALEVLRTDRAAIKIIGVETLLWSAIAEALQGRTAPARELLALAGRGFPIGPNEFQAWEQACFLLAPASQEDAIAFEWTRFPRFKDNDRAFFEGIKALLAGDVPGSRAALERCAELTVGAEFPYHLAAAALASPALAERGGEGR